MQKNILILTTVSGFLDKFEKDNVRLLQNQGFTVHYAANMFCQHYPFEEQKLRDMGIRLHHIDIERSPYMLRQNRKAFRQLVNLIEEYHIQAIHCHTPVGGVLGRLAGRYFGKEKLKVVYTAHGFHFYKGASLINNTIYYWVEKLLARYTDILVVINKEDYENAEKLSLRQKGKVYQIPGVGLDLEKFQPFSEKERMEKRAKLGLSPRDFFLVSVGELNENKNQGIVLQALQQMKERKDGIADIRYGICGDGFFRQKIENEIKERDLENHVKMYGYCTDVREILGCADMFIFPSKREGLGMAGLEALAMGIPLAASDNRGTREYMEHGKNGFVCHAEDMEGFVENIERLRALTEEKKKEMSVFCQKTARRFDRFYTRAVMRQVYGHLEEETGEEIYEPEECGHQCYYGSF